MLAKISEKIVIFVDEIDSVLSLSFPTDDFFAFIRACYNKRADNPAYKRLTFVLLGVATPSDLIQNKNRTPFNIGRAIPLNGFQLDEIQTLGQGLVGKTSNPQRVLQEIIVWTGGQPFLTQRICRLIRESSSSVPDGYEAGWIRDLVQTEVIDNWETQDEQAHLKTIRDRLLKSGQGTKKNGYRAGRLLGLYRQILQQGEVRITDNSEYMDLLLTGLVIRSHTGVKHRSPVLKVYNRIYASIFNQLWVEQTLANLRPYASELSAWLASNCQDESYLLREQTLLKARKWASERSLSDQDYQFLAASQELENRSVQQALEASEQANRILAEAQRKARRTIQKGLIGFGVISMVSAIVVLGAGFTFKNAQEKVEAARIQIQKSEQEAREKVAEAKQELGQANSESAKINIEITQNRKELADAKYKYHKVSDRMRIAEIGTKKIEGEKLKLKSELQVVKTNFEEKQKKLDRLTEDINALKNIYKVEPYPTIGFKISGEPNITSLFLYDKKKDGLNTDNERKSTSSNRSKISTLPDQNSTINRLMSGVLDERDQKEGELKKSPDFVETKTEVINGDRSNPIINPQNDKTLPEELKNNSTDNNFSPEPIKKETCLKKGDKGLEVYKLQEILKEQGFYLDLPTGNFDSQTEAAVIKYQGINDIPKRGIFCVSFQALLSISEVEPLTQNSIEINSSMNAFTQRIYPSDHLIAPLVFNGFGDHPENNKKSSLLLLDPKDIVIEHMGRYSHSDIRFFSIPNSYQVNIKNEIEMANILVLSSNITVNENYLHLFEADLSPNFPIYRTNAGDITLFQMRNPTKECELNNTGFCRLGRGTKPNIPEALGFMLQPNLRSYLIHDPKVLHMATHAPFYEIHGSFDILTTKYLISPGQLTVLSAAETLVSDQGMDYRVLELQKFLKKRGFYIGPLDGTWRQETQDALTYLRRDHGLLKSGDADLAGMRTTFTF